MSIWAIGDLHLSFGVEGKKMEVFGPQWVNHDQKIADHWQEKIKSSDLVLLPGDISWAMNLEQAAVDLRWIDALPGTKVMIRGNHDYWWSSLRKVESVLPPSIHIIQNNAFVWNEVVIAGARLWDTPEYHFNQYIEYRDNPRAQKLSKPDINDAAENERLFVRELGRLELSLKALPKERSKRRIVMTHYPPIGPEMLPSRASALLERYNVDLCVFGHLHNVVRTIPFGTHNSVSYLLTSADYIDFNPIQL